jgi:site-specific DNA-cytosine methylase
VNLSIGSLFAGIGGLELGLEQAGVGHTVWQVEKDPKCRAVLAKHWPNAERYDDVCTVGRGTLRPVDLICGGFPCQDISSAGKRAGLSGARSGLWFEYRRVVDELRPSWVVVENVASGASKWVDVVRESLEQFGYATLPVPLSASDCGAPHRRARIFIVGHAQHAHNEVFASSTERKGRSACVTAAAGSSVADADSSIVRHQQRRRGRSRGPAGQAIAESAAANSHHDSRVVHGEPRNVLPNAQRHGGWADEPDVARVVHGFSALLDEAVNAHEGCFAQACATGHKSAWTAMCSLRRDMETAATSRRSPGCACCGNTLPELPHIGRDGVWYLGRRPSTSEDLRCMREALLKLHSRASKDLLEGLPKRAGSAKRAQALGRVDRERMLGNAVVPAQAEVVGQVIRLLAGEAA